MDDGCICSTVDGARGRARGRRAYSGWARTARMPTRETMRLSMFSWARTRRFRADAVLDARAPAPSRGATTARAHCSSAAACDGAPRACPVNGSSTGNWPAHQRPGQSKVDSQVRFLAPFDPIVWDRRRFELFGLGVSLRGVYTGRNGHARLLRIADAAARPRAIGWANVSSGEGTLRAQVGYVSGRAPAARGFAAAWTWNWSGCGCFWGWADGLSRARIVAPAIPGASVLPSASK